MSKTQKADDALLAGLHGALASAMQDALENPEACNPAFLNVVRQFLRDNGITADGPRSVPLQSLADDLPDELPEYPQ